MYVTKACAKPFQTGNDENNYTKILNVVGKNHLTGPEIISDHAALSSYNHLFIRESEPMCDAAEDFTKNVKGKTFISTDLLTHHYILYITNSTIHSAIK